MDLSLKWIGNPETAIIVRMQESARREKAKAPTSPKVGALPFSLSSHKENRWAHIKPDPET
jgi:hypothetical protein